MTIAVYPGTFDPLTAGHEDIVRRAARMFPRVILAIADSDAKRPIFNVDERVAIAREVLADVPTISVERFSGLMVEFMKAHQARVVVRGVRTIADYEYELQLAGMNRQLLPGLETIFLMPSEQHQFVSGTLVREIATMGGDVGKFVSPAVEGWIHRKLAERAAGK